jgi:YbbR domain-containing protein
MFKHLFLKILAIIVAIILWMVVLGLSSSEQEIKGIPIQVKNIAPDLAASLETYEVDITVIGDRAKVADLESSDFEATFDLNYSSKGTFRGRIEIKKPLSDIKVTKISPEEIAYRVEDKAEKDVGIETLFQGIPAENHIVGNAKIEPEKVKAIGPKSEIENLKKANATIKLAGERENFTQEVELRVQTFEGKRIRSISFNPAKVKASVSVFAGSNNKAVGVRPKISGNPSAGFWVSGVESMPATVVINGDGAKLADIDYIPTSVIDITGIKKEKEEIVALVFPAGIVSVEGIKEVKITISLSALDSTREMYASVGFVGLGSGRRVVRLSPDAIKVAVSGPSGVLSSLTSSNISIEVELGGKEAGTHRIELKKENIKLPTFVGLISFLPNVIEVTLE